MASNHLDVPELSDRNGGRYGAQEPKYARKGNSIRMARRKPEKSQLNIALDRGFDRRAPPLCTVYRMVREGLQETIASHYFLYGKWDRLFGCWYVNKETSKNSQQELLPNWPVLMKSSGYAEASQVSVIAHQNPFQDRQCVLGRKSNYWFATYLSGIPSLIQDLCAPFGWMQWFALDLCHQIPSFYRFIHEERRAGRLGFLAAAMAAHYQSAVIDRKARREAGFAIATTQRRRLLSDLYGREVSRSAVRLVERLPANLSFGNVNQLLDALEDPDVAKALQHAEQVTVEIIEALIDFPADFRHSNIATLIAAQVSASHIEFHILYTIKLLSVAQRIQAAREFRSIANSAELKEWAKKWQKIGQLNTPFPPPPVPSVAPLIPISSYDELKAEGRNMRNCVETYWAEILDGETYFYHWDGAEKASLNIVSAPGGGWWIQEAFGFANSELQPETISLIRSCIALPK